MKGRGGDSGGGVNIRWQWVNVPRMLCGKITASQVLMYNTRRPVSCVQFCSSVECGHSLDLYGRFSILNRHLFLYVEIWPRKLCYIKHILGYDILTRFVSGRLNKEICGMQCFAKLLCEHFILKSTQAKNACDCVKITRWVSGLCLVSYMYMMLLLQ